MRALGFEPKKEEIKKMIADIDKEGSGNFIIISLVFAVINIENSNGNKLQNHSNDDISNC
jgi:Ca2+-binding EF-hand superfamily protein